jgi:hypothetical protein
MDTLLVSVGGLIDKLTGFVQQQSPVVWAIVIKQVYINAIQDAVTTCLALFGICLGSRWLKKSIQKYKDANGYDAKDGWTAAVVIFTLMLILCVGMSIGFGLSALGRFLNPEFYAIQFLLP